jgi:hypothetical protein
MTVRDNVIELRKIRHADTLVERIIHGAAAEIERLREQSERFRAERDEARREVCHLRTFHGPPRDYALERRWDCFEETIR